VVAVGRSRNCAIWQNRPRRKPRGKAGLP